MKYFLILIILLTPFIVRADESRFRKLFTSANDKFELRLNTENRQWSLIEKATEKEIYKFEADIASMSVLIGNDGKSIVAIDDYSEQDLEKNPEVLLFFRNGEEIKTYKLEELFDDTKFVMQTVSHFYWVFRNGEDFAIEDSKVNLQTFEMNNLSFDPETGKLLKKEKDKILSDGAVYVSGDVKGSGGDNHEITVKCVIYGKAEKGAKILFDTKDYREDGKGRRWEGGGFYESLIIKDGKLLAVQGVFFNRCN